MEQREHDEGQVSEVGGLKDPSAEKMPDQAVAGAPDAESGEVQEGPTGPNATTGDTQARHRAREDHDQPD